MQYRCNPKWTWLFKISLKSSKCCRIQFAVASNKFVCFIVELGCLNNNQREAGWRLVDFGKSNVYLQGVQTITRFNYYILFYMIFTRQTLSFYCSTAAAHCCCCCFIRSNIFHTTTFTKSFLTATTKLHNIQILCNLS